MKKKEDIKAHQNKNFESKKFLEDEQISPHRSALFINGKKVQAFPIQNFNPQEIDPRLEIFSTTGSSRYQASLLPYLTY